MKAFPKVQVKEAFMSKGEAAAREVARHLNIGDGKLRRWLNEWSTGKTLETALVAEPQGQDNNGHVFPFRRKEQVHDIGAPHRVGIIIDVGMEVSEVKWPNGHRQFVSNTHLRRVEDD